jgi:hypothetical protein
MSRGSLFDQEFSDRIRAVDGESAGSELVYLEALSNQPKQSGGSV